VYKLEIISYYLQLNIYVRLRRGNSALALFFLTI
jgi:hypothetical protein